MAKLTQTRAQATKPIAASMPSFTVAIAAPAELVLDAPADEADAWFVEGAVTGPVEVLNGDTGAAVTIAPALLVTTVYR